MSFRTASIGGAVAVLALITMIAPAAARDLCPERPGQTTPPCTVEPGRLVLETGLVDWSLQQSTETRSDTFTIGQSALRIGIAEHGEIAIGWTPFATQRVRDKLAGLIDHQSGVGDITFVVKRSFGNAHAPMAAIKTYVTAPVGTSPSGAGDWTAGAAVPVSIPLSATVQLSLTPEIDAVVNGSGSGHHIAYGSAGGLGFKLSNTLGLSADVRVLRDNDPHGDTTKATAGTSLAYQRGDNLQFDLGGNFGLNRDSPDVELYVGVAKRF
jgi:Putative MetA-pathway of phenol degradation